MEESQLIQRSQAGDADSFNQLVERYHAQVYNLALRMMGDASPAQDATQEAFLSAWQAVNSFRGGNFRAWLFRITANACRDSLRRQKRHPTVPLESQLSQSTTENHLGHLQLEQAVERGLASLPQDQRLAVLLSDLHGLSYEEMARAMGCSLGTVRSRLSRGRARLRDYLLQQGELLRP